MSRKKREHEVFDGIEMKYCSRGDHWRPATEEHFRARSDRWDGLEVWCLECQRDYAKNKGREKRRTKKETMRTNEEIRRIAMEALGKGHRRE